MTPRASPIFSTPRLALALLGAAWAATALIDVAQPFWIAVQATAWLGVGLLILSLLPGWRSRLSAGALALVGLLGSPLLSIPGSASDVRVATLNSLHARAEETALHAELLALSPDIVVLVETNSAEAAAVAELLGLNLTGEVASGGHAVAVLAQTDTPAEQDPEGFHQRPSVALAEVTVIGVHSAAPINARLAELWGEDLTRVAAALERPGAVIAAGDFNATAAHPRFRDLPGTDCSLPVPTWPMPVSGLHLDHIVISGAQCSGAGTFAVPGTDHRGVWADIVLG
ncbi:endonuclease/exonuclease/phosphatase family protein [Corynebacterium sp. A21]|uniref:endonuclease/exonuclease/phosphatase family protein n=1 Tax=Corynebacterium sp. A21 TaxID=3457318 RepID=UPI003FD32225